MTPANIHKDLGLYVNLEIPRFFEIYGLYNLGSLTLEILDVVSKILALRS